MIFVLILHSHTRNAVICSTFKPSYILHLRLDMGVHGIRFEDFTIEACRAYGIHGNRNRNIKITNMEIRNTGMQNIVYMCVSISIDTQFPVIDYMCIFTVTRTFTIYHQFLSVASELIDTFQKPTVMHHVSTFKHIGVRSVQQFDRQLCLRIN